MQYAIFLIRYGLTPDQVNELPLRVVELLDPVEVMLRSGE